MGNDINNENSVHEKESSFVPYFEYIKELSSCLIGIVIGNQLGVFFGFYRPLLILIFGVLCSVIGVFFIGTKWNYSKSQYLKKISSLCAFVAFMAGVGVIFR